METMLKTGVEELKKNDNNPSFKGDMQRFFTKLMKK